MPSIDCKIVDSISKISRSHWDALLAEIPEGFSFYEALEASGLPGFKFYYFLLEIEGEIALIAPLFTADFNLDIAVEGSLSRVIDFIRKFAPRFLTLKTLFCGCPFSENAILGLKKGLESRPELIRLLSRELEKFSLKINAPLIVFKDFLDGDLLSPLLKEGFSGVESFPSVLLELNFASFEEYLKSLGSSTRKNLNKKLRQTDKNLRIEEKKEVKAEIEDVYRLYQNTYAKGKTKFERLTPEFFLRAGQDLKEHSVFFLYYIEEKLAAFNLCFVYKDLLIDKFVGFDYDISRKNNLYFVSWAYNIKWCIANGLKRYSPGQTDYAPKLKLGGKLVKLYAFLKHRNIAFNFFIKALIPFFKPDNFFPKNV